MSEPGDLRAVLARALQSGLAEGLFAGGVVAVSRRGRPPVCVADGLADRDRALPCRVDTPFDVASLTKVVVTTPVVAALVAAGTLGLDEPVARWIEGVDRRISIRHLLTHRAGLWEWQPLYFRTRTAPETVDLAASLPLRYPPGEAFHYSDLSMILLGAVAERAGRAPLDGLFRRLVADPAGMKTAGFVKRGAQGPDPWPDGWGPPAVGAPDDRLERAMVADGVPYPVWVGGWFDDWRTHPVRGQVSDGNAWFAMGGVSGHAGLFTTAEDLVRFGHAFMGTGPRPLTGPEVRHTFLSGGPDDLALGFRVVGPDSVPGGPALWHGGFTGSRLLLQPATESVMVALTNRLHAPTRPGTPYPPDITEWWDRLCGECGAMTA